jgi:hypothetical protein
MNSSAAFLILSFDISMSAISAPDDTDVAMEDGTPLSGKGIASAPFGVKMELYVMIGAKRGWRCG